MTDWNITEAALDLVCPRCEARPGEACRTISGNVTKMHATRWNPISIAFGEGYSEGRVDGEVIIERQARRGDQR